jgi:hypothetical protein
MTVRPTRAFVPAVRLLTEPFVLFAAAHLSVLALHLPLFTRLPAWVFGFASKPWGGWPLIVALLIVGVCARVAAARLRAPTLMLCCLVVAGYVTQQGLAWSEGRGLSGMRDRMVTTGHAEFASVAVAERSLWSVATRYEAKVQGGELGRYARSKPPGQLLTYMATERAARLLAADDRPESRLQALRTLAAVTWPLLSYVVLVPLFGLARRLAGEEVARAACLLYIVVPSVNLITLHTDQFLFPLLVTLLLWGAAEAERRRGLLAAAAWGIGAYVAVFFSFALLAAVPLAAAVACAVEFQDESRTATAWLGLVRTAAAAALAAAATAAVAAAALHYDIAARFADARQFNAAWKGWSGTPFEVGYFGWMNLLEFVVWVGMPIAVLASGGMRRAAISTAAGEHAGLALPGVATAAAFGYLAFFGQNKGETARLWLFMVPICCALAAWDLKERYPERFQTALSLVVALQWVTTYLTKTNQDFW